MVIANSTVVTPDDISSALNIVIDDGIISDVTFERPPADHIIDGTGLVSVPGPIDPHVHYGVYSPIDQAAETESHAAAVGGVTGMMRMLRLPDRFEDSIPAQLDAMAQHHHIDYALHASVFTPQQIRGMQFCSEKNIKSFKIYMNLGGEVGHVYMDTPPYSEGLVPSTVHVDNHMVRETVREAAQLDCPVLVHAEDYTMCGCGIKEAQEKNLDGLSAWSESRPPDSEAKAIREVSKYARMYNCMLYFVHVGSAAAIRQIREEQSRGTRILVETCPHYLVTSHEEQHGYLAKVMPPIRTRTDRDAVWGALADGTIGMIGTDHVANRLGPKLGKGESVWEALAGFPGVGASVPIMLHEGVNKNRISIDKFAQITSANTANLFGLHGKGRITVGYDADIAMLDLKLEKKIEHEMFGGFSDYSIYEGMKLRGWPVRTIVRGQVICEDFDVIGRPGYGKMIRRYSLAETVNKYNTL